LKAVLSKVRDQEHIDDLKQHLFLQLLEKPDGFILELEMKGKLKSYVVKMIWNISHWTKGNFKPRSKEVLVEKFKDVKDDIDEEVDIPLHKLHWYNRELLKLYAECGTYQAVSNATMIPVKSVFENVRKTKKIIKQLI